MIAATDIPGIVKTVRERLERMARERHVELRLEDREYRFEDDWLYLCVTPTQPGVRVYDYALALTEVEKSLREEGIENVLLVPTLEEDGF